MARVTSAVDTPGDVSGGHLAGKEPAGLLRRQMAIRALLTVWFCFRAKKPSAIATPPKSSGTNRIATSEQIAEPRAKSIGNGWSASRLAGAARLRVSGAATCAAPFHGAVLPGVQPEAGGSRDSAVGHKVPAVPGAEQGLEAGLLSHRTRTPVLQPVPLAQARRAAGRPVLLSTAAALPCYHVAALRTSRRRSVAVVVVKLLAERAMPVIRPSSPARP